MNATANDMHRKRHSRVEAPPLGKPCSPGRVLLACIHLLWCMLACASVDGRTSHETTPAVVRIPFTLTASDNLSIHATLNGTDSVELMFHTAVDSVSMTKEAIARLSHFSADESIAVHSWGGTTQARHSTDNTLRIGDQVWREVAITEDDNSGRGTDGKFGPSLFTGKVVEIDFDARQLVIHSALPAIDPRFERLDLTCRQGALFLSGEIMVAEGLYTTEFMLHTGFGGTALLDEQFVRTNELDEKLATISESVMKDSYGSSVKTRKVRLQSLRLGRLAFTDVPVGIFNGAIGSQRMSILGGGLLKRCNLIIDAENGHLYVAPSRLIGTRFDN